MLTLEGLATGQVLQRAFTGGPPAAVSAACDRAGEAAVLRTSIPTGRPRTVDVYYGYGAAPRCTIVDADDRSIPAFGPVRIALPARPEVKWR